MNNSHRILTSPEELEFEDLIDFHFYWNRLRGERPAPRPWEFDPLDLPALVQLISIFKILDDEENVHLKFVGQSIVDHLGRDTTGELYYATNGDPFRERMMAMIRLVIDSKQPVVNGPRISMPPFKSSQPVQSLLLPLIDLERVQEIVVMTTNGQMTA